MCVSMWFEFFDVLFECQNSWYMGGKCTNKESNSNWRHLFPMVLGYKRGGDYSLDMIEPRETLREDLKGDLHIVGISNKFY